MDKLSAVLFLLIAACVQAVEKSDAVSAARPDINKEIAVLLEKIDLSMPGLEKVKAATNEPARAAAELLVYYRARTSVKHPVERVRPGDRDPARLSAQTSEIADDALRNVLIACPNYPRFDFGKNIDWLTNRAPNRDNEWLWQLNRHSSWGALADAWRCTGDEKYAQCYTRQIADWIRKCPVKPSSPAWRTIEAGIRGHSWTGHFQSFLDSPAYTPEILALFLGSCHEHAAYLAGRDFTSNNWGLMEAEGMAFIGFTFPEFKESAAWREKAIRHLNADIRRQLRADGHQCEQCLNYHLGCISWFRRTAEIARMNGQAEAFPADYWKLLEEMYVVLMRLSMPDGLSAQFGDTSRPVNCRKPLKEAVAFFKRADFLHVATGGKEGEQPSETAFALKESGFYSMRSGWDEKATMLVLKCGPDGHWHCQPDNGTFEIFAFGRRLMPDSGTYIYHGNEQAQRDRAWFRQTRVHQTLTLDGKDTAYAPKLRLWKPGAEVDTLVVENASYQGLVHRRAVFFVKRKFFVIVDEAIGAATGNAWLHFQFAPGGLEIDGREFLAHTTMKEGGNLLLRAKPQDSLKLVKEEGQVSFHYGKKEPRPALRFELAKGKNPVRFVTLLVPYEGTVRPEAGISTAVGAQAGSDKIELDVLVAGERTRVGYDLR